MLFLVEKWYVMQTFDSKTPLRGHLNERRWQFRLDLHKNLGDVRSYHACCMDDTRKGTNSVQRLCGCKAPFRIVHTKCTVYASNSHRVPSNFPDQRLSCSALSFEISMNQRANNMFHFIVCIASLR